MTEFANTYKANCCKINTLISMIMSSLWKIIKNDCIYEYLQWIWHHCIPKFNIH